MVIKSKNYLRVDNMGLGVFSGIWEFDLSSYAFYLKANAFAYQGNAYVPDT
jgi:hypothetical protein